MPGIFVAGDGAGIGGAQAAALQGALAGLAVAAQLGASIRARVISKRWRFAAISPVSCAFVRSSTRCIVRAT